MLRFIGRIIEALAEILAQPKRLYFILNNEDYFKRKVLSKFNVKEGDLKTISFESLGLSFPQKVQTYSFLGGTSAPTDIILLNGLANRFDNCNYFEIGTWRGESVVNLADATHHRTSLNLSATELQQKGYDENHIKAQGHYLTDQTNFTQLYGDSATYDFAALNEQYDLIFIDGDHHWEAIKKDTVNVFEHLIHKDSIVVWHDITTNYSTIWWEVLYGVLSGLPEVARTKIHHVRNTNCLVYIPYEVKIADQGNPYLPNRTFQVSIHVN